MQKYIGQKELKLELKSQTIGYGKVKRVFAPTSFPQHNLGKCGLVPN